MLSPLPGIPSPQPSQNPTPSWVLNALSHLAHVNYLETVFSLDFCELLTKTAFHPYVAQWSCLVVAMVTFSSEDWRDIKTQIVRALSITLSNPLTL